MTAFLLLLVSIGGRAGAVEPSWVQTFTVPATEGPPADECELRAKVVAPRDRVEDEGPPSTPTSAKPDTPAPEPMPTVDTAKFGPPVDLATLPLEPLRGSEADVARVRDVFMRAAARRTTTRLSFWGASHLAGEFFTGQVRRTLQERWGDAGHGFVMPGPPWTGYRASDVNLCAGGTWMGDYVERRGGRDDGRWGPAGFDVSPADGAEGWVQTTLTNPQGRAVSRFEVGFLREPGSGQLLLQVDDAEPITVDTSGPTGAGLAVLKVNDGAHRLRVRSEGAVRLYGTWMERDEPGIVVDAMGVSGRTASSWQKWDGALMAPYLERRRPDLVVLAYGTNEANDKSLDPQKYATSLRASLTAMRGLLPDAACILVGPSDRGKKVKGSTYAIWAPTEWVARVQREVGPEFGCATWDLQAASGGAGSMLQWSFNAEPRLAAGDLIHFSAAGYQELGRRFVAAMTGDAWPLDTKTP
jgi:lysophospholipase L1-like esterase